MEAVRDLLRRCPQARAYGSNYHVLHSDLKDYVASLHKLSKGAQAQIADDALAILTALDPAEDSISFLFVINLVLSQKQILSQNLLEKVVELLCNFDAIQVRYLGVAFSDLLTKIASDDIFPPVVTANLLVEALARLDPSGSMFTHWHLPLARLAYDSNCDRALRILDKDILSYPGTAGTKESRPLCDPALPPHVFMSTKTGLGSPVTSSVVLEYNLVRGLFYISKHDWANAQEALEQVITHPCKDRTVSTIMLDAHKRWLLVGLLNTGKVPKVPSFVSRATMSLYSNKHRPYHTVGEWFQTDDVTQFTGACEENATLWRTDSTSSLMDQVVLAYQKWRIVNLQNVYQCLSISEVRQATLNANTMKPLPTNRAIIALLREMVDSGMLKAQIEITPREDVLDDDGYLVFRQGVVGVEKDVAAVITHTLESIKQLGQQYRLVDERLSSNADYVRQVMRDKKRVETDKDLDPALGFETQVEDEDLMTGIVVHG